MYLPELKFSLWADFIERAYLDGEFKELIDKKIINGATSNPAIFKSAFLTSSAYKEQLATLQGCSAKEKYEALAIFDIQKAADILKPLYDSGDDGYVSIEVDPFLCDNAKATIDEAKRLYSAIGRENVMIKIPATSAGYIAMETLSGLGIAINATLIFSEKQAMACAEAFAKGAKVAPQIAATVISVFVSRIDRALDSLLIEKGITPALTGVYNSALIYGKVEHMQVPKCRTLFASTGVKGDGLPAHYYVDALLGLNSINTAPIDTIKAFDTNGKKVQSLPLDAKIIAEHFMKIKESGIDFDAVIQKQIEDGLEAFKEAFQEIMEAL
ncbi:MAG: transaldolase [Sulfurimonadaceae bacterium]|jgi:transaldolase|nr:transaldolase [Sulfurimonadaceae bacterium]